MLRVVITGGGGLLAGALKAAPPQGIELLVLGHAEFDLANSQQMAMRVAELRPQMVINTAAYNLVDRCETERELSWRINAAGPAELAALCSACSCRLIHYSTDYVFDGEKRHPYLEADAANPLNHYGAGKLAGEQAVLRADPRHLVLRTSWLFGEHPTQTKTYIHAVLRAVAEGKALRAARDQHSVPTYALDLACWTWHLTRAGAEGLFHAVNDEGVSRYDWTRIIVEEAHAAGVIPQLPEVEPVTSASFNPTMRRPAYTVLSNEKLASLIGSPLGSWRGGLRAFLRNSKRLAVSRAAGYITACLERTCCRMISERTRCRACDSRDLTLILDLGRTALANDFLSPEEVRNYSTSLPLRVVLCRSCSLVQLADTVDPKILYSRYAYVTSTSRTMEVHLTEQAEHLLSMGALGAGTKVLEIASNTGIFLEKFKARGAQVLGVEPATNIAKVAIEAGIPTREEFFNASTAPRIKAEWGEADLILGRHVFAHIDDLRDLLTGLGAVSHPETLIAFEVPYLVDFLEETEYDTIYHEHLSYVSVRALEALTARSPFFVQRIDHYPIHGGSILFHLRHRTSKVGAHPSVGQALAREKRLKLAEPSTWAAFAKRVERIRTELPVLIRQLKSQGKRIIGYGASAKGNTLLNTCGLGTAELDYIIDNTPFKQNKVAPGSWLPIRPPEALLKDQPDFALILAWNFAPEIIRRETEYQKRGGRFILPIPEPKVVEA